MDKIEKPWSDDQVAKLNSYQRAGRFHPFTCGNDRSDGAHQQYARDHEEHDFGILVATNDGWRCPACDYTQVWAHAFMAEELPEDPMVGWRNLDSIRKAVLAHMAAPDEVSLEPALEAMAELEPGDTPAGWLVLGTVRYFFFLRRWAFDDPAYGALLDKFYSAGVEPWATMTGAEYREKTAKAVSSWYKFDFPAVEIKAEEPDRKPAKHHSKKKKYRASEEHDHDDHAMVEEITRAPKDDGLEKRMAKRIAKQKG